jgi:large subunit ribosomal protein L10
MPNAEKVEKVATLKERIEGSNALLLAEYRGLSVHDATELRRSLSDQARFSIVKNTLFQRAAADAGVAELEALLDGPTAVAFVDGDIVQTAKRVVDAAKRFPALVLKGGYLDGKILSAAEAQALATLESREVLLSKVAGMMKAEMTKAASMFQAVQGRFLGVLEAFKEKVPGEAEEAAPEASELAAEKEAAAASDAEGTPEEPSADADASTEEPSADAEASTEEPADASGEQPVEAEASTDEAVAEAAAEQPEDETETANESEGEE